MSAVATAERLFGGTECWCSGVVNTDRAGLQSVFGLQHQPVQKIEQVSVEADALLKAIAAEAPKGGRPKTTGQEKPTQKIEQVSRNEKATAHKAAELFNTNRTYVNNAAHRSSSHRSPATYSGT